VVGKRTAERLKGSPNPAVRRTAIYLLREFGGSDALPDLTELLDDNEPQVQREAVRAILNIGTEQSYQVLEKALASGTDKSREAIMKAVIGLHDERATPLFIYIVRQVSHRGPLVEVYLRAIKSLGATRDPEAVEPLQEALYRGEWWAPRRTAVLRLAAAEALARLASTEADAVLSEAASNGPRGVRTVARVQLGVTRARTRDKGEDS
jgi:HEAT repeat protein